MKSISSSLHPLIFLELLLFLSGSKGSSGKYEDKTITDYTLKLLLQLVQQQVGHNLALPDQKILINQSQIFMNASISDGSLTDPSSFAIDTTHVNMTTLEFLVKVSYTSLSITGKYSLFLDNEYVHMESSDEFSIDIGNMDTSIYMKLNFTEEQTLQLENFIVDYNMTVKIDIKYLGGNKDVSDTLNKLINEVTPEIIQSTKPDVQAIAMNEVSEKSKFLLGGMTLQNFIDFVNSLVQGQ
ncbi:uncharacterized protein [Halyomorpha halys]|uniref:uncharacterized protein n=1 Tax=Halyomorpha halys TaxID=286706 RepID=UPI0006D502E8|nr:uncharacterized protein LOC106691924 [Halyomorpha halys]XP_014293677.1 uncharacterized protein LOC106692292 [Halyomorpha halys]